MMAESYSSCTTLKMNFQHRPPPPTKNDNLPHDNTVLNSSVLCTTHNMRRPPPPLQGQYLPRTSRPYCLCTASKRRCCQGKLHGCDKAGSLHRSLTELLAWTLTAGSVDQSRLLLVSETSPVFYWSVRTSPVFYW